MSGYWQFPRADRQQFNRQSSVRNTRRGRLKRTRSAERTPRRRSKHPERRSGGSVLDFERYIYPHQDSGYRVVVEPPGKGWAHVLTEREVRRRLAKLPECLLWRLHTVYLPAMTRKRQMMSCFGLQYGGTIYLYPLPDNIHVWHFRKRVPPIDRTWIRQYGGIIKSGANRDTVSWSPQALKTYYREHVLLHELGHINDTRNNSVKQRERFANYFAQKWGRL